MKDQDIILSDREDFLLQEAITLSERCPISHTAFAVGAILTDPGGNIISTGYSREFGDGWHAEQVAIEKAGQNGVRIDGAHLFSSLEPCSTRLSGKKSCVEFIIESHIARVVYCMEEPPLFVQCTGAEKLRDAHIEVLQNRKYAEHVCLVNKHLYLTKQN